MMLLKLIIISLCVIFYETAAERYLSNTSSPSKSPSYLFHTIQKVPEDNFPAKLSVTLSLSTFNGLLIYSMDKNNNSFVVKLKDGGPQINIRYRKGSGTFNLINFCRCQRGCVDEKLDLIISIKDQTEVQCNGGTKVNISYNNERIPNMDYPILPFSKDAVTNQAHIWIWNHQATDQIDAESEQMIGCIYHVKYNDNPIKFTPNGPNFNDQCPQTTRSLATTGSPESIILMSGSKSSASGTGLCPPSGCIFLIICIIELIIIIILIILICLRKNQKPNMKKPVEEWNNVPLNVDLEATIRPGAPANEGAPLLEVSTGVDVGNSSNNARPCASATETDPF